MSEFEEKICRYCFDGEESGELISPCKCIGGQKWVHLDCLRRWQRMVIVNQPTHPAYHQDDIRHHKCNVCLSEYTCPPPTRGELMESFTGPEIAASLFPGRIIVSRDIFSDNLERDAATFEPMLRVLSGYDNWIRGVYLITSVVPDEQEKIVTFNRRSSVERLANLLQDDYTVMFEGQKLRLMKEKSLSHITSDENLKEALRTIELPATIVLRVTTPITCADDHITAVNIARSISSPISSVTYNPIFHSACLRMPSVANVTVLHYIGGPVDDSEITTCIVTGGPKGWTVVSNLKKALYLAATRNEKKYSDQGDITSGQKVILTGLITRPELNGRVGMALRYLPLPGPQRWEVQLSTGEGLKIKPINLISDGGSSKVMVFWGDARWSRAQLLGEIARGHWGLCCATVSEFIVPPNEVWNGTLIPGRLAFAPISAMTDEILTRSVAEGGIQRQQMEAIYHTAAGARSITQPEENNNDNNINQDNDEAEAEAEAVSRLDLDNEEKAN